MRSELKDIELEPMAMLLVEDGLVRVADAIESGMIGDPLSASHCCILELFTTHHRIDAAFEAFRSLIARPVMAEDVADFLRRSWPTDEPIVITMTNRRTVLSSVSERLAAFSLATNLAIATSRGGRLKEMQIQERQDAGVVFTVLQLRTSRSAMHLTVLSFADFAREVGFLFDRGLLTVRSGQMRREHFARSGPLCPMFGYSRGTPIDRYYLNDFVVSIKDTVVGRTLEIGGRSGNRALYGFHRTTDYLTMDADPNAEVDIIADAHDRLACPARSFDSIVIINVLEHCARPWEVVENMHTWLTPSGKVFCLVPTAQRVHSIPKDYWRMLPDALESLFHRYQILQLRGYGNLQTSSASLLGIAAEELEPKALSYRDSRYPVVTCIVAQKVIN
jgi:SAM-dependent methyltransferase